MAVTVVPAYRVAKRFLRDVRGLPWADALDRLEESYRKYVQHLLSVVHPSMIALGERAARVQLGDPDTEALGAALDALDRLGVKASVEAVLRRADGLLSRPDMSSRALLFPGDGQSRVLVQQMHGVVGMSLGSQAMLLFLWPTPGLQPWLAYTVGHEYAHLVRNHLFPRGLIGGQGVYLKSQEPETLLDALVAEGIADTFAREVAPDLPPPWVNALSPEAEAHVWPRVRRRLGVADPAEIRRIVFGDADRIPQWTGYTLGYRIVQAYLARHPQARAATLVGLTARAIFEGSTYTESAVTGP